jgi:polyisoprenoid-binding protein YceI
MEIPMFRNVVAAALFVVFVLCGMQFAGAESPPPLAVPAGTYVLEKTHASLLWRVDHMGMSNYTARFKSFDARVDLVPSDLSRSRVEATIDLASVETDFVPGDGRDFNAELRSAVFFHVARFPQARFQSRSIRSAGSRRLTVLGDLVFLGVSQPITLEVVLNGAAAEHPFAKKPWLGFSARGTIPRNSFGLDPMPQLTGIGDKVEIVIEAEFIRRD